MRTRSNGCIVTSAADALGPTAVMTLGVAEASQALGLATGQTARYPSYAIDDQHAAGALMWSVGSLGMVAALVVGVWTYLQHEERRARAREAYLS